MAQDDLLEFIQERLLAYDPTIDLTSGSAADIQIIQPLLARYGVDPFTMPLEQFIGTRLSQEFPDVDIVDGDAVMDLLVKPARVLFEPIVQEINRVRNNLSFANPATLELSEADALGANYFTARNSGDFARVNVRLYFTVPQSIVVSPSNYCYTGGGLNFLPTSLQSITVSEMLFNKENNYYYFDIFTIAEQPGGTYNVPVGAINSIYGLPSVANVFNKLPARYGVPDEDVVGYMSRIQSNITERSPVVLRGIASIISDNFSEVTCNAVAGFNDPEMQRDILQGSGIGPILSLGSLGYPVPDGKGGAYTTRIAVRDADVDFTQLIGPVGVAVDGFTLSIASSILLENAPCGDFTITAVIDMDTLEVDTAGMIPWHTGVTPAYWAVRKNQLTLSGVPGGTELPTSTGLVTVLSDQVHIGGMTDIYVRGNTMDQGAIVYTEITDEMPLLSGINATCDNTDNTVTLCDYTLGVNYYRGDSTYQAIDGAKDNGWSLQTIGDNAASFRIIESEQPDGGHPVFIVSTVPDPVDHQRWRLLDKIDIDLVIPKEVRLSGGDMYTLQGQPAAIIPSVTDLTFYDVKENDQLGILNGPDKGIYTITVTPAGGDKLTVDRDFTSTATSVSYEIYRPLAASSMNMPFTRIRSIDVLDSMGQSEGISIPYANPADVRAYDFTTPTNSPYIDVRDGMVGCVGKQNPDLLALPGTTLSIHCDLWVSPSCPDGNVLVTFSAGLHTVEAVAEYINDVLGMSSLGLLADTVGGCLTLAPFWGQYSVQAGSPALGTSAFPVLFDTYGGDVNVASTRYIRSTTVDEYAEGWNKYEYNENFDVVQVVGAGGVTYGSPAGTYGGPAPHLLQASVSFMPAVNAAVTVGPRAVGRVRTYFLDPTTIEVDNNPANLTRFTATLADGSKVSYFPDPTINTPVYPPPPDTEGAIDGVATGDTAHGILTSVSVDFLAKGIRPGDQLYLDYVPIISDRQQRTDQTFISDLAFKKLVIRMAGTTRTICFGNDTPLALTGVTLSGVETQLNNVLGAGVAYFNNDSYLCFNANYELWITDEGTAASFFWVCASSALPVSNLSLNHKGGVPYTIYNVLPFELDVVEPFPTRLLPVPEDETSLRFHIVRPGAQRVGATQMSKNTTYSGLYYADFQLVSEGTGQIYNVLKQVPMTVTGHKSLGYYLTTKYSHLTFSEAEQSVLHLSPTLMVVGSSDDPENAVQLAGQNIQLNYDWSSLTASVQTFMGSESERVVNENVLVRHLLPHFVRFDLTYQGGQTQSVVLAAESSYVQGLSPSDTLDAVCVQNLPMTLGANIVSTPVNLVAVVHNEDRSVVLEQSQDFVGTSRLAGFFVDQLNINQQTT